MTRITLHALTESPGRVLGTWSQFADPDMIDVVAAAGYRFTIIDCEHGAFGIETAAQLIRACEAANINSNQLWLSLGGMKIDDRKPKPGSLLLSNRTTEAVRTELKKMGYTLSFDDRSSGPINAIWFDWKHGSFWGGSSNNGEDYGIGW